MRRREFIAALTAFGSLPLVALAQTSRMPVVGFLSNRTRAQAAPLIAVLLQGLKEAGFIEGQNIAIEYRLADGDVEKMPALAAELVARQVDVIVSGGNAALAIAATRTIPIVFTTGFDPVAIGFVKNLNRPEANVTGATFYSGALGAKQMEILKAVAPNTERFALLVKTGATSVPSQIRDTEAAARAIGVELAIVSASSEAEFEPAIAGVAARANAALLVSVDPFFDSRSKQLVELAARHKLPTAYYLSDFVKDGGLVSYGASIADAYRQAGVYAGRLLKGAKPAELPIQIPTRFELAINLKTASALNLSVTPTLLAQADEVIE